MDLITTARSGDFAAIPAHIDFANSAALADFIDGYGLAGDEQRCSEIYFGVIQQCRRPGAVRASPIDLWVALFYAHDAYRQAGSLSTGDESVPYDRLARELRAALVRLAPKQKAGVLAAFQDRRAFPPEMMTRGWKCSAAFGFGNVRMTARCTSSAQIGGADWTGGIDTARTLTNGLG